MTTGFSQCGGRPLLPLPPVSSVAHDIQSLDITLLVFPLESIGNIVENVQKKD